MIPCVGITRGRKHAWIVGEARGDGEDGKDKASECGVLISTPSGQVTFQRWAMDDRHEWMQLLEEDVEQIIDEIAIWKCVAFEPLFSDGIVSPDCDSVFASKQLDPLFRVGWIERAWRRGGLYFDSDTGCFGGCIGGCRQACIVCGLSNALMAMRLVADAGVVSRMIRGTMRTGSWTRWTALVCDAMEERHGRRATKIAWSAILDIGQKSVSVFSLGSFCSAASIVAIVEGCVAFLGVALAASESDGRMRGQIVIVAGMHRVSVGWIICVAVVVVVALFGWMRRGVCFKCLPRICILRRCARSTWPCDIELAAFELPGDMWCYRAESAEKRFHFAL